MKWIAALCSTLCLFTVQAAIAEVHVTMSGPSPAIASSYNVGDSNTLTYTITNNVPNKSFPITVSGLSGPVSRTTVAGDCGSSLPKGPSTYSCMVDSCRTEFGRLGSSCPGTKHR